MKVNLNVLSISFDTRCIICGKDLVVRWEADKARLYVANCPACSILKQSYNKEVTVNDSQKQDRAVKNENI